MTKITPQFGNEDQKESWLVVFLGVIIALFLMSAFIGVMIVGGMLAGFRMTYEETECNISQKVYQGDSNPEKS